MPQRGGCDQLVDIFLVDWWWDKWESASSVFWFQLVWGVPAFKQHAVKFFFLVEVSISAEQLKDFFTYIPWGGTKTLNQGCTIVSKTPPPLSPYSFSCLIGNCLNLTFGTQGRSRRLFPANKKWGTQKGFCAQEPHMILLGFSTNSYMRALSLWPNHLPKTPHITLGVRVSSYQIWEDSFSP